MQCALKWLEKRDLLQDWAEKACVRMRVPGSMPTKNGFLKDIIVLTTVRVFKTRLDGA